MGTSLGESLPSIQSPSTQPLGAGHLLLLSPPLHHSLHREPSSPTPTSLREPRRGFPGLAFCRSPSTHPRLQYPQGPRLGAPDCYPLRTQASGPGVSSPVSLSVDQPGTPREQPPMPRGTAPPPLPGPGFFSHGARALAALRPPGSRLARSLLARCQVPAPPRATAHARLHSFSSFPSPRGLGLGELGLAASAGSRAPRRSPPSSSWLRPTPPPSVSLGEASPRHPYSRSPRPSSSLWN